MCGGWQARGQAGSPCSAPRAAQSRDAHVRGTAVVGKEVTYRRRRSRAPQYSHPLQLFFSTFSGKRSDCGECRCSWFWESSVAFVVTEKQPPADPSGKVISIFIQTPARASPCRVSATYTCQAWPPRLHLRTPWEHCTPGSSTMRQAPTKQYCTLNFVRLC